MSSAQGNFLTLRKFGSLNHINSKICFLYKNVFMQGTVFGSLISTSVIDKLAKIFDPDEKLLYKYKKTVNIPLLGIVNDVLSI